LALTAPALAGQGKTELLWLGQAAFRIDTPGGKVIPVDPFITQNPKRPRRGRAWTSSASSM
jgi:L-ascorbate metabolism protein UlaG (beta-lactamase superfamily)